MKSSDLHLASIATASAEKLKAALGGAGEQGSYFSFFGTVVHLSEAPGVRAAIQEHLRSRLAVNTEELRLIGVEFV